VRWRKANFPELHNPDGKGYGDSRLRPFNGDAFSFNKFLPGDTAVSSGFRPRSIKRGAGRGSYAKDG